MGFLGRIKDGIKKFNLWIVVVVAFGVYITFFSDYNYFRSMEYDARIKDLKAQIKECDDSTAVYRERLRLLESDHETLERIVREEYLMKRENEDLYIVKEKKQIYRKNEKGKCTQHIAVGGNGDIAAVGFSAACGCENAVAALHLHLCGNAHRRGARVSARGAPQTDVQPARAPSFHDGVLVGDVLCGLGAVSFLRPIPQHVARLSDGRRRGAGLRVVYD